MLMLEMVSHVKCSEISLPARSVSYLNFFFWLFLFCDCRLEFLYKMCTRLSSTVCLVKISKRTKLILTENLNHIVDLLSLQFLCSSFPIWAIGIKTCFRVFTFVACSMPSGHRVKRLFEVSINFFLNSYHLKWSQ